MLAECISRLLPFSESKGKGDWSFRRKLVSRWLEMPNFGTDCP